MKKIKNDHTGVEEMQFGAKLISISEKTFQNSNNNNYKVVTIEFENAAGETVRTSAIIYEGNYNYGVEMGETYTAVATPMKDGGVIVKMSHLVYGGVRATADMFGFDVVDEADPANVPNKAFETETTL